MRIMAFLLLLPAFAEDGPAEQFKKLAKEYDRASASGVPLTDAQRLKFIGEAYKQRHRIAEKLVDLAEKHPADPVALDALAKAVWQVNTTPWPVELVGEDRARGRAFRLLQRDHLGSSKLGPICQRLAYGFAEEYETFLRAVAEKNKDKAVKATALLSLGRYLNGRVQRLDLCREQPSLAKEFAGLYGKDYLERLLKQERGKDEKEAEAALERAAKLGEEEAKAELFGMRNLAVGKEAPDIEGEDQDGKRFKLSDYRGKVVLLDFWSHV